MTDERALRFRAAKASDASGIFSVLAEVAPEIKLEVEGDERKAILREQISQCCAYRLSLVATDDQGRVVGFLLARHQLPRAFALWGEIYPKGLELPYAGVTKSARKRGVFHCLIERVKKRKLPLYATVHHTNQSGMAERLAKIGFSKIISDTEPPQDHFIWRP